LSKLDPQQPFESKIEIEPHAERLARQARATFGNISSQQNTVVCGNNPNGTLNKALFPQVIISVCVEAKQKLDLGAWKDWLSLIPVLAQKVEVDGFDSRYVTLGERDLSKITQIPNLCKQIALTTTNPPLPGPTRCSADEMEEKPSQTSEEDYQWDISDTAYSIDKYDLGDTPRSSHPDALNIGKFLESNSACLKRDIVDLLMNDYYEIFGRSGSGNLRKRLEGQEASHPNRRTGPGSQTNSGISNSKDKRKAEYNNKEWGDDNGDEPAMKRQRHNTCLPGSQNAPRRYACPYHMHNTQKFRRSASRAFAACDNEGFDTIGHLK